jgi:hypothetical protein
MDTSTVLAESATELKPLASFHTLPDNRGRTSPRTLLGWVTRGVTIAGRVRRPAEASGDADGSEAGRAEADGADE